MGSMKLKKKLLTYAKRPSILALFSGALVLIAFYVPYAWFLVFVALIPLYEALRDSRSHGHAFLTGFLAGAVIAGGTSFWYFASVPPLPDKSALINFAQIAGSWFMMVVALAPAAGVFGVLARHSMRQGKASFFLVPLLWIATESARMVAFTAVTFAPGVANPPFYSTGFIGYPLADSSSWLQLASLGGIYLMSFVVAGVAYLLYRMVRTHRVKALSITLATLLVVSFMPGTSLLRATGDTQTYELRVGIMTIHTPEPLRLPGFKHQSLYTATVAEHVALLAKNNPEVILLPEGGNFLRQQDRASVSVPMVIDVALQANPFGIRENVGILGTVTGETVETVRAKQMLTPQGEYVIGLTYLAGVLFGFKDEVDTHARRINVAPARWGGGLVLPNSSLRASLMFCSESLAPHFGRAIVQEEGSHIIFTMNSHGSFRNSRTLEIDTLRFLKVRSVEAGVPMVVSADQSPAYVLNSYGEVLFEIGRNRVSESAVVTVDVPIR